MNTKRLVWLPPDGDVRLVRFQQDVCERAGLLNGTSVPPHVELSAPNRPRGEVRLGAWTTFEGEPVLEAWDDEGLAGVVRFSLSGPEEPLTADRLPAPPDWHWNRGVTAVLELSQPDEDASFVLWTWTSRHGWKADPAKG